MLLRSQLTRTPLLRATQLLARPPPPLAIFLSRYNSTSPSPPPPPPPPSPKRTTAPPFDLQARSRHLRTTTQHQLLLLRQELDSLRQRYPPTRSSSFLFTVLLLSLILSTTYQFSSDFRRILLAGKRCALVGWAVAGCVVEYKLLFRKTWDETTQEGKDRRHEDYEECHRRCAVRLREVLKKNGGIYIKLGQHISSIALIPVAWSSTMLPLQDHCHPTPLPELQALFLSDVGAPLSTFFSSFDEEPIGVASLAQVHVATDRESGRRVAVKIMHPDLEEFCAVDMKTTTWMLRVVKRIFPTFEFTWLGEEMEQNLPLEMDFRHEAANASRCASDFAALAQTTLVVPEVLWAKKRAMVMEFIQGSRIDDLEYLKRHNIDRNRVAQQLSHIFSRMIYITGFFHADPHGGNLLIRPRQPGSRSPYNFEIVLLDHGLYFDMSESLRVNYAHLWLSLISPSSPAVELDRRKYAALAGNITPALYPIFQAAITGRAALDHTRPNEKGVKPGSMLELDAQTNEDLKQLRTAVAQDGLMKDIFELLRRVPRRMLMVLKVNDLTRALDKSLQTTHGPARIFVIVAEYCNLAIHLDDLTTLSNTYQVAGLTLSTFTDYFSIIWRYESWNFSLKLVEIGTDWGASVSKFRLWWRGYRSAGWKKAWDEAAGLGEKVRIEVGGVGILLP